VPVDVLYVTHHLPWPVVSGGRRREAEILARLSARYRIELVAISKSPALDWTGIADAARLGIAVRIFPAVPRALWHPLPLPGLLTAPLARQHHSPGAVRYLAERLRRECPAVLHVEGHYLLGLLPRWVRHRVVLVEHNVESVLLAQRARTRGPVRRAGRLFEAALTRRDERRHWDTVATVGALTSHDADIITRVAPRAAVCMLPSGADHLPSRGAASAAEAAVPGVDMLFVANFGYSPNVDAARVLIDEVYPRVASARPGTTIAIVGRQPPAWLRLAADRDPNILLPGWVPSVGEWLARSNVFVCPLRIGGGIKIKVLEAVAAGACVVTTTVGAQGLDGLPAGTLLIRDDPAEMAATVTTLLSSPALRARHAALAATAAGSLPTWQDAAERLADRWDAVGRQVGR
jgi:polysaccharide biosynthesis protein PslH